MRSYDYTHRKGVQDISWQDFETLVVRLAEGLEAFQPQIIIGIARAGLFPATTIACMLRLELFPTRLTRRVDDQVVYDSPVWKVPISTEVADKVVGVVDEIADTGETLAMAAKEVKARGAKRVITACLVSHTWANPKPDLVALVSDALVIFPWDRKVLVDGHWQPHPEILAALIAQDQGGNGTPQTLMI